MNKTVCLAAAVLAFNITPIFGQPLTPPPRSPQDDFQRHLQQIVDATKSPGSPAPELTKFNLDFHGGRPEQLVAAIEEAMGKPLNVIINREDADVEIPPLKMNNVVLTQLFTALGETSRKAIAVSNGTFGGGYSTMTTDYGFRTADNPPSDSSVWCFYCDKPAFPPVVSTGKTCQFYSLAEYLNRGFTVDDITTAIQTGWNLAGDADVPELKYHKETKLLIAYGAPAKLATIQNVLNTLPSSKMAGAELDALKTNVRDLQGDIHELKTQLQLMKQTMAPGAKPEEKSGK